MQDQADVRRAWAVLGLEPGADVRAARRRYRQLAKRWHPDRFANDPRAQVDAGVEMRRLNAAYRCLLESARDDGPPEPPAEGAAAPSSEPVVRPAGRRLSRDEVDAMVAAMGSPSWIDWMVDAIPGGAPIERLLEWLFERRPLGPFAVMRATAMGTVIVAGYALCAVFTLSDLGVPRRSLEVWTGAGMILGVALLAYGMRENR